MSKKKAVVVGSRGQDGRLLTDRLKSLDYEVSEITKDSLDITDRSQVASFMASVQPNEVYFLAAYHHSSESVPDPGENIFDQSMAIHYGAALNFLEAIHKHTPSSRLFYASSSHIFGSAEAGLQNETTPAAPESIYAISKISGMMACRYYRTSMNVFASIGILYNHESTYRAKYFLSSKIAHAAATAYLGSNDKVELGNLNQCVDWGAAEDYVRAMSLILQLDKPDDFVISTSHTHTVREFADIAFNSVNLDYRDYVTVNPVMSLRPTPRRAGDYSKLKSASGWEPTISFTDMVKGLVMAQVKVLAADGN